MATWARLVLLLFSGAGSVPGAAAVRDGECAANRSTLSSSSKEGCEAKDVHQAFRNAFRAGHLLVHMKGDWSGDLPIWELADKGLQRWKGKHHLDYSLSYSLLHPRMVDQNLFQFETGYLIDGSKCDALAGSRRDMGINNAVWTGEAEKLETETGRNVELLRLLLTRYLGTTDASISARMHVVLPAGFLSWARGEATKEGGSVMDSKDARLMLKELKADEGTVVEMLARLLRGDISGVRLAPDMSGVSLGVVEDFVAWRDAEIHSSRGRDTQNWSEVLAQCPLEALAGFVFTKERGSKHVKPGKKVVCLIRKRLGLSRPLVVAEYQPASSPGSDATLDVRAVDCPSKGGGIMKFFRSC